jgi:hypothetical protein
MMGFMKFAVSIALLVVFLALPVNCILAACRVVPPSHHCCHRTGPELGCPYDVMDTSHAATYVTLAAIEPKSIGSEIAPPIAAIDRFVSSPVSSHGGELHILNRILRI